MAITGNVILLQDKAQYTLLLQDACFGITKWFTCRFSPCKDLNSSNATSKELVFLTKIFILFSSLILKELTSCGAWVKILDWQDSALASSTVTILAWCSAWTAWASLSAPQFIFSRYIMLNSIDSHFDCFGTPRVGGRGAFDSPVIAQKFNLPSHIVLIILQ